MTKRLNKHELWDAADTIMWVNAAAAHRIRDLKGTRIERTAKHKSSPCFSLQIYSKSASWIRIFNSVDSRLVW